MQRPLHFEAQGTFKVSPRRLWPLLADTPRLNRAIGLPPIEYDVRPDPAGGSQVKAQIRLFGLPVARWTEHPFRWEAERGYLVLREFDGGPLRQVRGGVRLEPIDGGTRVTAFADILPRNALGALAARLIVGPQGVNSFINQCRAFEAYLNGQARDPFPALAGRPAASAAGAQVEQRLLAAGQDPQAIALLRQHLAEASDEQVVKMRPFELADRWGLDRRKTLALFLHATTAGLLVLSWDVLCPNCRIGKREYFALRDLQAEAHCETCNIRFDASFDRLVEARFSVAPAVRRTESREFCIGGPMNTPHIVAQTELAPGQADELRCTLRPGLYRLRVNRPAGQLLVEAREAGGPPPSADDRPPTLDLQIEEQGVRAGGGEVPAGPLVLRVANQSGREQVVALEGNLWPDTIATAALVSSMQEFRDLFSSEALAPGLQLGIENLAFMFTDLTGSTALYENVGQARAFRLVQDQFQILGVAIAAHRGALVKTIGDAVMAAFISGDDALAAALQIQHDIRQLQAPPGVAVDRLVKIGLHQGPCVAVTLNERLDYFGTTVNTAARIEHECRGGQIVASQATCETAAARALLEQSGARVAAELVNLRGLSQPVPVYRIEPAGLSSG
jgi:class 3 adenylate cyclase